MKIYYFRDFYDAKYRGQLFPLLKPFIKGEHFTDAQRIAMYGLSERDFLFTDNVEEADLVILTMAWNYYVKTGQTQKAITFVKACQGMGKKVLAINVDDFGVRVPFFENLLVLRSSGYRSRFSKNEFSIPPFINDPVKQYFNSDTISLRNKSSKPVIGFCGQANTSLGNALKETCLTGIRNLKFYLGLSNSEPQQLRSSTFLRASVLMDLKKSPKVVANFILRKKYRAGVKEGKTTHETTLEFYNNLKDSDYVVCVRGAGNFSIRFYEALAMGRIPVFINTDCALPLENEIVWKNHVVWVDYKDRKQVAQKISDFHSAMDEKGFQDLQCANRKLWEERLTLGGFFREFHQIQNINN